MRAATVPLVCDDAGLLAAAPATAYRECLYRPHGVLARWIGARFGIVARPCQPIYQPVQDGDVLLEVVLGRMSPGRCTILAAGDLQLMSGRLRLAPGQLLLRPRGRGEIPEPTPADEESAEALDPDLSATLGLQDPGEP